MTCSDAVGGNLVMMARVGKVHGLKGWVHLNSFTDPRDSVLRYRRFYTGNGRELVLDEARFQGTAILVHFEGCDTPEQARLLTGTDIGVQAHELPELSGGEYYWYQLEGLKVYTRKGELLGEISRMLETGANDVMVVEPVPGSVDDRERLIPWLPDSVVRKVDLENGCVTVDWEAEYLQ